jgi:hypothetical protein
MKIADCDKESQGIISSFNDTHEKAPPAVITQGGVGAI